MRVTFRFRLGCNEPMTHFNYGAQSKKTRKERKRVESGNRTYGGHDQLTGGVGHNVKRLTKYVQQHQQLKDGDTIKKEK